MKLLDLCVLTERADDELELQRLSKVFINASAKQYAQRYEQGKATEGSAIAIRMGQLRREKFGHLYDAFVDTKLTCVFVGELKDGATAGSYIPADNVIRVVVVGKDGQLVDRVATERNLVHEMRHRLDDYLSKGHAFRDQAWAPMYYDRPFEINARFSQAAKDMVDVLVSGIKGGWTMSLREFIKLFEEQAVKHGLMQLFVKDGSVGDDFIRLLTRSIIKGDHDGAHKARATIQAFHGNQPIGDIGAFHSKQYKRFINRLAQIYYTVIERT